MIAIFELYLCMFCNKNAYNQRATSHSFPVICEEVKYQVNWLRGVRRAVQIHVCVHSETGKGVETLLISQKWPFIKEEGEEEGSRWFYCWPDTCRVMQPERTDEYLYTCHNIITKSYSKRVYQNIFFFLAWTPWTHTHLNYFQKDFKIYFSR